MTEERTGTEQLGALPPPSYGTSLLAHRCLHPSGLSPPKSQWCPTIVHEQMWPQPTLLQKAAGCWCWGGDFSHRDVKAQALQLLHEFLSGRLCFVSAEPQL